MMNTPKGVASTPPAQNRSAPALASIVFDLDGVLVDVSASYRKAILATVAELGGGQATPEDVQALKNEGGFNNDWDLSQELLRRAGRRVELARVIEVFNHFYLGPQGDGRGGLIEDESWLLEAGTLAELKRRYRLAIFTGRPRTDAAYVLRRFGVIDAFDEVVTMEDVERQKPDPEGLYEMQRRQAPGLLAAYVGDTVDDARCADAAGIPFIAILPPTQLHRDELEGLFRATGCLAIVADVNAAARHLIER